MNKNRINKIQMMIEIMIITKTKLIVNKTLENDKLNIIHKINLQIAK